MVSHIVLYKTNPNNPLAAEMIIKKAKEYLANIFFGDTEKFTFHAAFIPPSDRAVGNNDFQVVLNFIFANRTVYKAYMEAELHLDFVYFVLRGWMIKGSTAEDPEAEFIDYILHAGPDSQPVEWARNPAIPEEEVVWAGEKVYDAPDES